MKKIAFILLAGLFILTSCGKSNSTDIINSDAEYLYFFGATCPHCQELNRLVEEEDLFSKISVEKREVYFNNENREIFLKLVEEIKPERDGVPFVYDKITGEVAIGVGPALELFKSRLDGVIKNEEILEEKRGIEFGGVPEDFILKGENDNKTMTGEVVEENNTGTTAQ